MNILLYKDINVHFLRVCPSVCSSRHYQHVNRRLNLYLVTFSTIKKGYLTFGVSEGTLNLVLLGVVSGLLVPKEPLDPCRNPGGFSEPAS